MNILSRDDRPWGYYEVLLTEDGIQVKRIVVHEGKRLSLQTHRHRAEHWFIKSGLGLVTVGDSIKEIHSGSAVSIARGEVHRVEALKELTFYEVQIGSYLGEDDIVRIEDDFGR
jgi:mannose-6-phosphate isomerase-like protein (cupin superfamily)